jgi:hypothetical protein
MRKPKGFNTKRLKSLEIIARALDSYRRPVALSSFGKDSLCLLRLMEEHGVKTDIAYFELGANALSHRFAREFIRKLDAPVTILHPHDTTVVSGEGGVDLAYLFQLQSGDTFQIIGATFDDTLRNGLLCGRTAGLVKRRHHGPYDWDLLLTGLRRVDFDATVGSLALR